MTVEAVKQIDKEDDTVRALRLLNENIPRDVISKRKGGAGKPLDYLEGWYVIDRLNYIFGPFGWHHEVTYINQVTGPGSASNGADAAVSYTAKVRLSINGSTGPTVREGLGYGSDKGNFNPHELALKEAETDALKRAAMKLGRSMGLALYDKTQEYVDETENKPTPRAGNPSGPIAAPSQVSQAATVNTTATAPVSINTQSPPISAEEYASACKDRDELTAKYTAVAKSCILKKKFKDASEVKGIMQGLYGTQDKSTLSDTQLKEFLITLYNTLYGVKG